MEYLKKIAEIGRREHVRARRRFYLELAGIVLGLIGCWAWYWLMCAGCVALGYGRDVCGF